MYLPDLFNRIGLFQHLGGFVDKDGEKRTTQINEFLLHATSFVLSLYRINYLNDICVKHFNTQKANLNLNDESRILFTSPQMVEMITLVPSCFTSLCVMQDKIFPMLDYVLQIKSPPQSFHAVCNKIKQMKLRKDVADITDAYWKDIGKRTRDYRDVGQHFYSLVAHSYYQIYPKEKTVVLLPDNPNEKSYHKFTYTQQQDCTEFLTESFNKLHKFIEDILELTGFPKKNLQFRFNMGAAPKVLQEGIRETMVLAFYDDKATLGIEIGHTEERKIYVRGIGNWENKESTKQ